MFGKYLNYVLKISAQHFDLNSVLLRNMDAENCDLDIIFDMPKMAVVR